MQSKNKIDLILLLKIKPNKIMFNTCLRLRVIYFDRISGKKY